MNYVYESPAKKLSNICAALSFVPAYVYVAAAVIVPRASGLQSGSFLAHYGEVIK